MTTNYLQQSVTNKKFTLLWEVLNCMGIKQKPKSKPGQEWTMASQKLASVVQSTLWQGKLPYWWTLCRRDTEQVADLAGGCSNLNKSSLLTPPAGNIRCTSPGPGYMFVHPMNRPQFHLDHPLSCLVLWVQTTDDPPELTWSNKW